MELLQNTITSYSDFLFSFDLFFPSNIYIKDTHNTTLKEPANISLPVFLLALHVPGRSTFDKNREREREREGERINPHLHDPVLRAR